MGLFQLSRRRLQGVRAHCLKRIAAASGHQFGKTLDLLGLEQEIDM
jgi:hypothetical protein